MSAAIFYLCEASEHQTAPIDPSSKNLTVHRGKWAVCAAGRDSGHRWTATKGIDYENLTHRYVAENRSVSRAR